MAKKKNTKDSDVEDLADKKKTTKEQGEEEDGVIGGDDALDPAIIEDTFTEEFSEYNDVDNF
jgi:hypothetical protein